MKIVWFEEDPALYAETQAETTSVYPHLHFFIQRRVVFVAGSFPLIHDNIEIDRYQIEIELPDNYPGGIPRVREIGRRIPITADRHMYNDGTACLFVIEDWLITNPNGTNLLTFLNGPVRNFFIGQSLVEAGEEWPFGQRSHGIEGILECYAELVGSDSLRVAYKYLEILSKKKIKGHWWCPCGSGSKIRDCHKQIIEDMRQRIPHQVSRKSWKRVQIAKSKLGFFA